MSAAELANQRLVDCLIADGSLWSPAVIAAFRATPRHRFLDRVFQFVSRQNRWREVLTRDPGPEELRILYSDRALITHLSRSDHSLPLPVSSSSQPSLMAQMLEDLNLSAGLRVLEVGAGTGYNAALLAHVVGPGNVVSIDVDRNVLSEAWDHLRFFADRGIKLAHADGRHGYPESAPYERIMVTAATPDLEPAWLEQLAGGGWLSAPLVLAPGLAFIVRGTVERGTFDGRLLRAAYFMPLRAEGESGASDSDAGAYGSSGSDLVTVPAPWGDWFGRRRLRSSWLRFSQALAFFGWLHGLEVRYRGRDHGLAEFAVSRGGSLCWFGLGEWQTTGADGTDLGQWLWQQFLEAGGPWPTEFRLRACPGDGLSLPGNRGAFCRQGPWCRQQWELLERRERQT
jgi:protein-L-isoaspartate(D-aspartate) O-methyltransferase